MSRVRFLPPAPQLPCSSAVERRKSLIHHFVGHFLRHPNCRVGVHGSYPGGCGFDSRVKHHEYPEKVFDIPRSDGDGRAAPSGGLPGFVRRPPKKAFEPTMAAASEGAMQRADTAGVKTPGRSIATSRGGGETAIFQKGGVDHGSSSAPHRRRGGPPVSRPAVP